MYQQFIVYSCVHTHTCKPDERGSLRPSSFWGVVLWRWQQQQAAAATAISSPSAYVYLSLSLPYSASWNPKVSEKEEEKAPTQANKPFFTHGLFKPRRELCLSVCLLCLFVVVSVCPPSTLAQKCLVALSSSSSPLSSNGNKSKLSDVCVCLFVL